MKARMSNWFTDESGQAVVLIAFFLVVLLGVVGMVVDVGYALTQRRQMQNAADAAALAGARELALGSDRNVIWNKLYEYGVTRNKAGAVTGTFYPDGQVLNSNPGTPPTQTTGVCVVTSKDVSTMFMTLFGIPVIHLSASACAYQPPSSCGGNYALWANSTSCSKTIDWTGGTWRVTGDVHSNNDINVSGTGNQVNGICEYVSSFGSKLACTSVVPVTANTTYPVNFNIADYKPGGRAAGLAAAAGRYYHFSSATNFSSAASLPDGLYYFDGTGTTGISAPGLSNAKLTMVSEYGRFNWSAGSGSVAPYIDNLLLFSTASQNCNSGTYSINYSGSNSYVDGILFAPNGGIQMSGSSNSSLGGNIISNSIKLSGSSGNIDQSRLSCRAGPRTIKLVNH